MRSKYSIFAPVALVAGGGAIGCKSEVAPTPSPTASATTKEVFTPSAFPAPMQGVWWKDVNGDGEHWRKLTVGPTSLTVDDSGKKFDVHCVAPNSCSITAEFVGGSVELAGEDSLVVIAKLNEKGRTASASEKKKKYSDRDDEIDGLETSVYLMSTSWVRKRPNPTGGAKPAKSPSPSGSSSACEAYAQCVCDFAEELGKHPDVQRGAFVVDCDETKKAYGPLGAMAGADACSQLLTSYKDGMKSMESLYATMGVSIPSSCK